MSHDGARAYISHFRSGSVSLIDTAPDTVTAALEDALIVLDEQAKNLGRAERADFPVAVAASPGGEVLYVSNYFSAAVSVIAADKIALDLPGQGTPQATR